MRDPDHDLTPEHRREEIATILAAGLLRYYRRIQPTVAQGRALQNSTQNQLDVSAESWTHGPTCRGLTACENERKDNP